MAKHSELFQRHEELTHRIYTEPGMLPARYVYVLTNRCNLRCPFCFQYRHKTRSPMETEDWLQLTQQLPDYARVTLTGGEPLVFKGFREVLTAVAARYDCNIISNGALLNEEWIRLFVSLPRLKVVSLSLDDIGNRNRAMKPDEWQQMVTMSRRLVELRAQEGSNIKLDIKTMVLDENADQLFAIHRYCVEELHCDTHAFQFLKGSPLQHADTMSPFDAIFDPPASDQYQRLDTIRSQLEQVRQHALKHDQRVYLHPPMADLHQERPVAELERVNEAGMNSSRYEPCKFPWSSVHINADGDLFPCMAVSMGNVKEQRLPEIIHGPTFERFRAIIRQHGTVPGCRRCGYLRPTSDYNSCD
jgi:MoaA/NifB/PqqE/SkfB family radical SAM enzyme